MKMLRFFAFAAVVCAGLSLTGSGQAAKTVVGKLKYLQCDFDKTSMVLGFSEYPPRVIDGFYPDVELKELTVTDQRISFSSDNPFHSHELYSRWVPDAPVSMASSMKVMISRLTGGVRVSFFAGFGPKEKAACQVKDGGGPWCNYPPLTDMKTGTCRQAIKRF
jgi:hypothetical protein